MEKFTCDFNRTYNYDKQHSYNFLLNFPLFFGHTSFNTGYKHSHSFIDTNIQCQEDGNFIQISNESKTRKWTLSNILRTNFLNSTEISQTALDNEIQPSNKFSLKFEADVYDRVEYVKGAYTKSLPHKIGNKMNLEVEIASSPGKKDSARFVKF